MKIGVREQLNHGGIEKKAEMNHRNYNVSEHY